MPDSPALAGVRHAIDRIDDGLLLLLAGRRRLVAHAAAIKRRAGIALRDPRREARVHARAQALARRVGVPAATADGAIRVAMADAWRAQGIADDMDQGDGVAAAGIIAAMLEDRPTVARRTRLLRLLPPPARLAPLLRALPAPAQRRLLEAVLARVLAAPLDSGALGFMAGRRLGIEVSDLGLHWVLELRDGRLRTSDAIADASVRGSATDLLLLASRLEDADTLFFQRRLLLTGDTELGLTVRNLLDRLPWESVPLGLRIVLHRGARLARAARDAHHGRAPAGC